MDITNLFEELTDPRDQSGQIYPFENLMLMAVCAAFAGIDSFVGIEDYASTHKDFFDQFFKTSYFPRHDTFNRLFGALDMVEFEQWFRKKAQAVVDFVSTHNPNPSFFNHIAIDGKTIRNSGFTKPYHIVTAWLATNKIALGQVKVDEKSNEITAIPELIAALDLEKTVVTSDAMGCQRQICKDIIAKGGHYLIAVKDNQPTLFENVIAQIEETFEKGHSQTFATNKGHGRHEKRWCLVMNADKESYNFRDWPGIKSIIAVDSDVVKTDRSGKKKHSQATRYFVSSTVMEADQALEIIRAHWGIEINLHWCLDVSFEEDTAGVQLENAAINLSVLRKFSLNSLTAVKGKKSLRSMFRYCMAPQNAIKILNNIYDA